MSKKVNHYLEALKERIKEYNISYEELKQFRYCGSSSDINYWNIFFEHKKPFSESPQRVSTCLCGHDIIENCYIYKDGQILVVGNRCKKRFMDKPYRTCNNCGDEHKNRIINLCSKCRGIDNDNLIEKRRKNALYRLNVKNVKPKQNTLDIYNIKFDEENKIYY